MPRTTVKSVLSSTLPNGGSPGKKKRRLDAAAQNETDDNETQEKESSPASVENISAIKEKLLQAMSAAVDEKQKFPKFDFNSIQMEGYSSDQLRAAYESLRTAAFRNLRRLPLKQELRFVDELSSFEPERKVKKEKDAKKKILTGYLRFLEDVRPILLNKRPDLKKNFKEAVGIMAEQWRNLSDEQKRPYQEAYMKEKQEYIQAHPELAKPSRESSKGKKGPPKSAFDLFCAAKRDEYSGKYGLKGNELKTKLATKFAGLSERKREKWEGKAREAMDEYLQVLTNETGSQADAETGTNAMPDEPSTSTTTPTKKKSKGESKLQKSPAFQGNNDWLD